MSNTDYTAPLNILPMSEFIGTKLVNAKPMTRGDYNALRGWTTPANENPADEGYFVEYVGTEPNFEGYGGYVSWTTKAAFDCSHVQLRPNNGVVSSNQIMQFFSYAHLPVHLQTTSRLCAFLAQQMDAMLPDGPEKSVGLRKLLEAKDAFVRSATTKKN